MIVIVTGHRVDGTGSILAKSPVCIATTQVGRLAGRQPGDLLTRACHGLAGLPFSETRTIFDDIDRAS